MWGMIQAGNHSGFALKPFPQFRAGGEMSGKDLDGHNSIEACRARDIPRPYRLRQSRW